jgi:hypothetical protein
VTWDNEPAADHIALDCSGHVDNLCAGSVASRPNMEDGLIHKVRILYNATTKLLSVYWDGALAYSVTYDLVADLGTSIRWGWTSGSGGASNEMWMSWNGTTTPPCYTTTCNPSSATTGACATAPVKFINVSAKWNEGEALINWSTAEELSNKSFSIEKSEDAIAWNSIGEVPGAGNSSSVLNYSFTDASANAPLIYYRIRQIDQDGKSALSFVVSINNSGLSIISIHPNPFDDKLEIRNADKIVSLELFNMQGELIESIAGSLLSGGVFHWDLSHLRSGDYLVKITDNSYKIILKKIIKK